MLEAGVALGLGLFGMGGGLARADDPAAARPQPGDRLVFVSGDHKDKVVTTELVSAGGPQVLAFPFDPTAEILRNRSRLNQVALVKLDPATLSEETGPRSVDGILAYSAICTHHGCIVSNWDTERSILICPCHASWFDPANAGTVVAGPAKRRLALLPLAVEDDVIVVAGAFEGKLGFN